MFHCIFKQRNMFLRFQIQDLSHESQICSFSLKMGGGHGLCPMSPCDHTPCSQPSSAAPWRRGGQAVSSPVGPSPHLALAPLGCLQQTTSANLSVLLQNEDGQSTLRCSPSGFMEAVRRSPWPTLAQRCSRGPLTRQERTAPSTAITALAFGAYVRTRRGTLVPW